LRCCAVGWSTKHVVLAGNMLFFYAHPLPAGSPAPRRVACVDGAVAALAGAGGKLGSGAHAFDVRLRGGGCMTLAAASGAEAARWVSAIAHADYSRCVPAHERRCWRLPRAAPLTSTSVCVGLSPPPARPRAACTSAWARR